jgi:predicted DNA-binding transcriptional regulator YafY
MGLSSLSDIIRGNELINALVKVKSFIPADKANDIELKTSQICIDLSTWIGNQNTQSYLEIIKTALQDCRLVSFEYIAHHGKKSALTCDMSLHNYLKRLNSSSMILTNNAEHL